MSYSIKTAQEIENYREVENIHDLPQSYHYWANEYLRPKCEVLGFSSPEQFYIRYIEKMAAPHPNTTCNILSVGAGNCDIEVALAETLAQKGISNYTFSCLDLNPHMLERGRRLASERGVSPFFKFIETDINNWKIDQQYQIIIASQSLHHFVDLEILFQKTYESLDDAGFFLTSDMIGRNGHMRWPEVFEILLALWSLLEDRHKWNRQLNRFEEVYENWDCSKEGFEGIRAQDILPLLLRRFKFESFIGFAALISVFVDRSFGHNFDMENPRDKYFIDFVARLDDYYIETGRIKPTQMYAAMTKYMAGPTKIYKHLTPEFCVRWPAPPDLSNEEGA